MKPSLVFSLAFALIGFLHAQLSFVGAGIQFKAQNGPAVVDAVLRFSPAEDAGIRVGEKVWAVDGQLTAGKTNAEVVAMIKGSEGAQRLLEVGDDHRQVTITLRTVRGRCTDGDCQSGEGRIEEPTGHIYVGNFEQGKFEGYGTYYFYRGETMYARYEGHFHLGQQEGEGKLRQYERGYAIVGKFKAGSVEGLAKATFESTGSTYEGNFVKGVPTGSGTLTRTSGQSQTIAPKNWDELVAIGTDQPLASDKPSTPPTSSEARSSSTASADDSDDLEPLLQGMQRVESALYNSFDAYSGFHEAYARALSDGNSESAEHAAQPAFLRFFEPYGKALEQIQNLKSLNGGSLMMNDRSYAAFHRWSETIREILDVYADCKDGDHFSPTKFYWANLNPTRLHETLDRASAARHEM